MSSLPTKNLIFLQDSRNNLKFLVDSGVSISIRLHSSSAPPTGPHLVGANGKQIPAWGLRRRTVCFSGHNFEFDFLLAAVATPILVMDFLARFELSIMPAKQQVLHEAAPSPRQVPLLFLAPGVLRPPPQSPLSRPRYNNCSRNSRRCCAPAPPLPSRSTASYISSTQVAPPPCSPALGGWTRRNTASPTRNFSPWRKQVLFATQTCLGRPRCTWSPRRIGRGTPAPTIAASTPSQYLTGTPSPIWSPSMSAWPGALFFRKSIQSKPAIRSPSPKKTS
jgi:hypothetical protein